MDVFQAPPWARSIHIPTLVALKATSLGPASSLEFDDLVQSCTITRPYSITATLKGTHHVCPIHSILIKWS